MKMLSVSFERGNFMSQGFITYTNHYINDFLAIDVETNEIIEDEINPLDVTEIYLSSYLDEGNINEVRYLINKHKEEN